MRLDASSLSNNVDGGRIENIFKDYRTKKILADVSISSNYTLASTFSFVF